MAPSLPAADRTQRLVTRSNLLIEQARFMTLATVGPDGAWASTVNFVPLRGPLRLLWYSLRAARHSVNIEADGRLSASLFMTGIDNELGLDGAQFTGTARAVGSDELTALSQWYYERNFADPQVREQWRLDRAEYEGHGPRRFYVVDVDAWWLFDLEGWLEDKNDRRIAVPLDRLHAPLPGEASAEDVDRL
ncbi:pyridoxamine 5'-phosphate oxidase family protein [Streptomyces sp. NPDC001834]|uniref:pyridoxamine 5'-phosphate oxidase family protein n=1 Tax=Streptomyces sp. NPDC001834 TaxID=3364616 RepID=UPI00367B0C0C